MIQMNQLPNHQKPTRKSCGSSSCSLEIQALQRQNKKLKDSIYLQQKTIHQYIKQKLTYETKLKEYQNKISILSQQIAKQRKKILGYIREPFKRINEGNTDFIKQQSSKNVSSIKEVLQDDIETSTGIIIESQNQDKIIKVSTDKETPKSPKNAGKLVNCIRKMASLSLGQNIFSSTLVNENRSQPMLRTFRDLKLSFQFGSELKQKDQYKSPDVEKPNLKKSYLQKIKDKQYS